MHPARSLILFTSLSGLGFGLLAFLCLGLPAVTGWTAFFMFAIGFACAGAGLLASTFHLGHPERAVKAFTQWRSSWLSREAWLSVAALGVSGLYAALLIFLDTRIAALGLFATVLSVATVYATSMIYAQLKTVPRWNDASTSAVFMAFALAGGALVAGQVWAAIGLLLAAAAVQIYAWQRGDRALADSGTNMATATGLQGGTVTAFEAPHTGGNYLTHEMVHVVARKHAAKLRVIGLGLAFALPVVLLLLPFSHAIALLAILSHVAGVLTLRWLFFAEAEHVVGLYYGKR